MTPLTPRPGAAALAAAVTLAVVVAPALRLAVAAPSWAASAASSEAHAQPGQSRHLGRLFSTPQERALLDARRDGSAVESQPAIAATAALPATPPEPLLLNGVVQRSNGATTVWLNDAPLAARGSQVLPDRSVSIKLPSGKRITLKPGQSYDEATGAITNAGQ
ncbi:hypothetical protein ASD15_27710 [Massilia sp. Root351]|uniref:hypothetical protein n=1 Tax=Massilia sp. Root351 TaxID=1736522 RepID=UPI00070B6C74|nr:hypothetical protein [Massilia sp. Root351]KQV87841.1 hypothetical protein ASD15_27710 [Massilia sp. Root351]